VIVAAGAVLWRPNQDSSLEVCVVHRPKYDDWSLPKGKLLPAEHLVTAAVREVWEETGHRVALGRPLPSRSYEVAGQLKRVHYWAARADDRAQPWQGTKEIDRLEFLPVVGAVDRLTVEGDAELVRLLAADPAPTQTLILLRHAHALARDDWSAPDSKRPLSAEGVAEAAMLTSMLASYGIELVVTSDAERCLRTVRPYVEETGAAEVLDPRVAETDDEMDESAAAAVVQQLLADDRPSVVCTHRPVLPSLYAAIGVEPSEPLHPGDFLVVHHRKGVIVATERHVPRPTVTLFT
jgi:8-oxo-(d)GTP phosphatase